MLISQSTGNCYENIPTVICVLIHRKHFFKISSNMFPLLMQLCLLYIEIYAIIGRVNSLTLVCYSVCPFNTLLTSRNFDIQFLNRKKILVPQIWVQSRYEVHLVVWLWTYICKTCILIASEAGICNTHDIEGSKYNAEWCMWKCVWL